eukprot:474771-Hanusia_phi.AAC.1
MLNCIEQQQQLAASRSDYIPAAKARAPTLDEYVEYKFKKREGLEAELRFRSQKREEKNKAEKENIGNANLNSGFGDRPAQGMPMPSRDEFPAGVDVRVSVCHGRCEKSADKLQ